MAGGRGLGEASRTPDWRGRAAFYRLSKIVADAIALARASDGAPASDVRRPPEPDQPESELVSCGRPTACTARPASMDSGQYRISGDSRTTARTRC